MRDQKAEYIDEFAPGPCELRGRSPCVFCDPRAGAGDKEDGAYSAPRTALFASLVLGKARREAQDSLGIRTCVTHRHTGLRRTQRRRVTPQRATTLNYIPVG